MGEQYFGRGDCMDESQDEVLKKRMLLKKKIEEERTKKSEEGNKSSKEEVSQPSEEQQKKVASESKVNESPQIPQQAEKKSLADGLRKMQEESRRVEESMKEMMKSVSQLPPEEAMEVAQTMNKVFDSSPLIKHISETSTPRPLYLSELFLIHRDGKLAESLGTFKDENEARLSMLYTVQNIIKELNRTTQTQGTNISSLQFDDKTIAIEGETNTYLVAVIEGNEEPKGLRKDMQRGLMRLQSEYPKYLSREYPYGKDFTGAKRILAEVWNKYCNSTKKME